MNYKILPPEKEGQKFCIIPTSGSGQCWETDTEEQAKQILRFIKNKTPKLIQNIRKLPEQG